MKIGYGRVSTRQQNPDSQKDALFAAGCEEVYIDKISGKLASRPELDKVMLRLRDGDTLVITRLDRLGRSLAHLIELSARLNDQGVSLVVLEQGIDTSTALGRMFFHIIGAIAEFEHALISERTREGLEAARARGRKSGPKPKLTDHLARQAKEMYDAQERTVQEIADKLGVSRPAIYRAIERIEKSQETPR